MDCPLRFSGDAQFDDLANKFGVHAATQIYQSVRTDTFRSWYGEELPEILPVAMMNDKGDTLFLESFISRIQDNTNVRFSPDYVQKKYFLTHYENLYRERMKALKFNDNVVSKVLLLHDNNAKAAFDTFSSLIKIITHILDFNEEENTKEILQSPMFLIPEILKDDKGNHNKYIKELFEDITGTKAYAEVDRKFNSKPTEHIKYFKENNINDKEALKLLAFDLLYKQFLLGLNKDALKLTNNIKNTLFEIDKELVQFIDNTGFSTKDLHKFLNTTETSFFTKKRELLGTLDPEYNDFSSDLEREFYSEVLKEMELLSKRNKQVFKYNEKGAIINESITNTSSLPQKILSKMHKVLKNYGLDFEKLGINATIFKGNDIYDDKGNLIEKGKYYISYSQLIKSTYLSTKYKNSAESIGSSLGTQIHKMLESSIKNHEDISTGIFEINGKFYEIKLDDKIFSIIKSLYHIENGDRLYPEFLITGNNLFGRISDKDLKMFAICDLVIIHKDGTATILDYKTSLNKKNADVNKGEKYFSNAFQAAVQKLLFQNNNIHVRDFYNLEITLSKYEERGKVKVVTDSVDLIPAKIYSIEIMDLLSALCGDNFHSEIYKTSFDTSEAKNYYLIKRNLLIELSNLLKRVRLFSMNKGLYAGNQFSKLYSTTEKFMLDFNKSLKELEDNKTIDNFLSFIGKILSFNSLIDSYISSCNCEDLEDFNYLCSLRDALSLTYNVDVVTKEPSFSDNFSVLFKSLTDVEDFKVQVNDALIKGTFPEFEELLSLNPQNVTEVFNYIKSKLLGILSTDAYFVVDRLNVTIENLKDRIIQEKFLPNYSDVQFEKLSPNTSKMLPLISMRIFNLFSKKYNIQLEDSMIERFSNILTHGLTEKSNIVKSLEDLMDKFNINSKKKNEIINDLLLIYERIKTYQVKDTIEQLLKITSGDNNTKILRETITKFLPMEDVGNKLLNMLANFYRKTIHYPSTEEKEIAEENYNSIRENLFAEMEKLGLAKDFSKNPYDIFLEKDYNGNYTGYFKRKYIFEVYRIFEDLKHAWLRFIERVEHQSSTEARVKLMDFLKLIFLDEAQVSEMSLETIFSLNLDNYELKDTFKYKYKEIENGKEIEVEKELTIINPSYDIINDNKVLKEFYDFAVAEMGSLKELIGLSEKYPDKYQLIMLNNKALQSSGKNLSYEKFLRNFDITENKNVFQFVIKSLTKNPENMVTDLISIFKLLKTLDIDNKYRLSVYNIFKSFYDKLESFANDKTVNATQRENNITLFNTYKSWYDYFILNVKADKKMQFQSIGSAALFFGNFVQAANNLRNAAGLLLFPTGSSHLKPSVARKEMLIFVTFLSKFFNSNEYSANENRIIDRFANEVKYDERSNDLISKKISQKFVSAAYFGVRITEHMIQKVIMRTFLKSNYLEDFEGKFVLDPYGHKVLLIDAITFDKDGKLSIKKDYYLDKKDEDKDILPEDFDTPEYKDKLQTYIDNIKNAYFLAARKQIGNWHNLVTTPIGMDDYLYAVEKLYKWLPALLHTFVHSKTFDFSTLSESSGNLNNLFYSFTKRKIIREKDMKNITTKIFEHLLIYTAATMALSAITSAERKKHVRLYRAESLMLMIADYTFDFLKNLSPAYQVINAYDSYGVFVLGLVGKLAKLGYDVIDVSYECTRFYTSDSYRWEFYRLHGVGITRPKKVTTKGLKVQTFPFSNSYKIPNTPARVQGGKYRGDFRILIDIKNFMPVSKQIDKGISTAEDLFN